MAIDGKAAAGKSNCAALAKQLGFASLDSGSIFRAATLLILQAGVEHHNPSKVKDLLRREMPRVSFQGNDIALDGHVLGDEIRTPEVSRLVPWISKHHEVREIIVPIQREFARGRNLVAEGRDMTSVVFVDANVRIFLTADLETRALRRFNQYKGKNPHTTITLKEVLDELVARDHEDETRPHSPLVHLPGVELIDSTHMTKAEVVAAMFNLCQEKDMMRTG